MAAETAAEGAAHAPTASEYIVHHLQHLQKDFSFNSVKQTSIVDFSLFNLLGSFILFHAITGKYLYINDRAIHAGRHPQGRILYIRSFFTKYGSQQFFFRG
mgnify:CR=1 FL=1